MADGKEVKSEVGAQSSAKPVDPAAKEHWRKGNALFEESKFEDSVKEYTEALAIDDGYADAYFNRALTERMINDFAAARADLERVLELQPKSYDAPLLIGDMAENRNDLLGARYWYERALANNPEYTEAKTRLERIDSLIHVDNYQGGKGGTAVQQQQQKGPVKAEQQKDVVEEGQIKKVAFFKSEIKFKDVIGLRKVKKYLAENVVLAIKEPALFKRYGKKLGVGLLLYGPPGVGKTHIVKAIAGESGANVIIARVNQIVDMYTGNTEKNLHAIFEQARKNTPCIIFFDELDALGVKRGGDGGDGGGNSSALRLAVNQFLVEMSGVETNPEGIYVIGATNNAMGHRPCAEEVGQVRRQRLPQAAHLQRQEGPVQVLHAQQAGRKPQLRKAGEGDDGLQPRGHREDRRQGSHAPAAARVRQAQDKKIHHEGRMIDTQGQGLQRQLARRVVLDGKKDVISKTETQTVNGKKQETVKEGKLDAQEKILYKAMVKDIKKNTKGFRITLRKFIRWWALHLF